MKHFFFILFACFVSCTLLGQAPHGIPYQSVLRSSAGNILSNQTVSMRFSLHDSIATGTIVYQETHTTSTNNLGLVTINIGEGTASISSFSTINWGHNAKFLQIEMDANGGTNYIDLGTQQMMSVPYALYAISAGQIKPENLPNVTLDSISNIQKTSALLNGSLNNLSPNNFAIKGFCWSINPNPSTEDSSSVVGVNSGRFSFLLQNILPNTTYYVRAYASNMSGTTYSNEISFSTDPLGIGDSSEGGIIYYIFETVDPGYIFGETHGLIAAPTDQGAVSWGCAGLVLGNTSDSLGAGKTNTLNIISSCSQMGTAARMCNDLNMNGYSDWYLPSKDELNKLYLSRTYVGGFQPLAYYWTSTEYDLDNSWDQLFPDGTQFPNSLKANLAWVRAIRSF